MSGPFSPSRIADKIAAMPRLSSQFIRQLRQRGETEGLADLIAACDRELSRRPFDYTEAMAKSFAEAESKVAGYDLAEATRCAFRDVIPSDAEKVIIPWIAANPGGSAADLIKVYGKGDVGLAIGYIVEDRYGYFSKFADGLKEKSAVLIERHRSGPSVRYTLRPEVLPVFKEIGLA